MAELYGVKEKGSAEHILGTLRKVAVPKSVVVPGLQRSTDQFHERAPCKHLVIGEEERVDV